MIIITTISILAALLVILKTIHIILKPHIVELVTIQDELKRKTYYIHSNDFYLLDLNEDFYGNKSIETYHMVVIKSTSYKFYISNKEKQRLMRYLL